MNKTIYLIFLFFLSITLLFSCKKPKLGEYILTVEGEEYFSNTTFNNTSNPVTYTTTAGTKPYLRANTLHLNYSGNSVLEFDGQAWAKDGNRLTNNSLYSSSSLGGGSKSNSQYLGDIISKTLIIGNYTSTYSAVSGYSSYSSTITASFKIKKK